jgi:ATP-binding cassette subfamily F protein 3
MGNVTANHGIIQKTPPNLRISHLKQEFIDELTMNNTLYQELMTAFMEQRRILDELHELEAKASSFAFMDDPQATDDYFDQVREVQAHAKAIGAFKLDGKILKVIESIGFKVYDLNRTVSAFSGGWKMRVGLAKLLCSDP